MKGKQFADRFEAGRFLAEMLERYHDQPDVVVLALPRGGVPVGYEIALALNVPLDVFLVRKLGLPGQEELAIGAIASGAVRVLNHELLQQLSLGNDIVEAVTEEQKREPDRREREYRAGRAPIEIKDHHAILVDDGLATGASMRAAVRALRQRGPSEITVAVPVGAPETCAQFRDEVDEVICGRTPEPFNAVGMWYAEFKQVSDEEVSQLLDHAAHELRARRVQTHLRHRRGCQEEEQTVRTFEDKKGQIYADADGEPR